MSKRNLKPWKVGLGIVVVLSIGGFAMVLLTTRRAKDDVARATARLHALGVPTTPQELARSVPHDQNAAPFYDKAAALQKSMGIKYSELPTASPDRKKLSAYVQAMTPVTKIVLEASERPDCEFAHSWKFGSVFETFPEHARLKEFVKLCSCQSQLAALKGDWKAALEWNAVGFRIARHCDERDQIGLLVRLACEAIALTSLDRQIVQFGDSAEFRQAAGRQLDRLGPLPTVYRGLFVDAACETVNYAAVTEGSLKDAVTASPEIREVAVLGHIESVRLAALAKSLGFLADAIETMHDHPDDWRLAHQALADIESKRSLDHSLSGKIVELFASPPPAIAFAIGRLETLITLDRAALKLYEVKAQTGSFPRALPANLPVDPFSGKPFIYRLARNRFILYSVGPNGKDEGGKIVGESRTSDDIEMRVPRP